MKSDLVGCGFTLNKKSVWTPTQQLPWLGHILNFKTGITAITEEKINKLKQSIRFAFSVNRIKVLQLASIAGQIIAMSLAIGSWARLMTRSMSFCISQKKELVFCTCTKPRCSKRIKFLVGQSRPVQWANHGTSKFMCWCCLL